MLSHPTAEGTTLLGFKDTAGREIVREMLTRKEGVLRYTAPAMNGKSTGIEKIGEEWEQF